MTPIALTLCALPFLTAPAGGAQLPPKPLGIMAVSQPGAVFLTDNEKTSLSLGCVVTLVPEGDGGIEKVKPPEKNRSPKGTWWWVRACTDEVGWVRKGDLLPVDRARIEMAAQILSKLTDKPASSPRYWAEVMDFAERAILDTPADRPVAPLQVARMQAFVKALELDDSADTESNGDQQPAKPDAIAASWWGQRGHLFIFDNDSGARMLDDSTLVDLERPLRGTKEGDELLWIAAHPSFDEDGYQGLTSRARMRYLLAYPAGRHVNELLVDAHKVCEGRRAGGQDPPLEEQQRDLAATADALKGVPADKFPAVAALRRCIAAAR